MPELDGLSVLREIHGINPQVKAVMVSGYSLDHLKEEEIAKLTRGFLKKPFQIPQLLRQIKKHLDEP